MSLARYKNIGIESFAVICGAAYTLLISYGNIWCWLFAVLSSIAFIYLCFDKKLLAETGLHVFYLAMGIYGYFSWGAEAEFNPHYLNFTQNLCIILFASVVTFLLGYTLKNKFSAALPYLDAFTTVFSIVATFMMIKMLTENWIYWIVIDALSIYLYSKKGLKLSALLYLVYVVLAINGLINWL